jgi:hypothetical protein
MRKKWEQPILAVPYSVGPEIKFKRVNKSLLRQNLIVRLTAEAVGRTF